MGASGVTADEISQVIGFTDDFNHYNISKSISGLTKKKSLQVANKVYIAAGKELNSDYQTSVREQLKSDVESIDFNQNTAAAKSINDWIANQTNHKITDMVAANTLDGNTLMLLVNAVYFKASWMLPFNKRSTKATFTNVDATTKEMDFMQVEGNFKMIHVDALSARVVRLPYAKIRASMFVVLPDDVNGLSKVEENLDKLDLNGTFTNVDNMLMNLKMPPFDFKYGLSLNEPLKKVCESSLNTQFLLYDASHDDVIVTRVMKQELCKYLSIFDSSWE